MKELKTSLAGKIRNLPQFKTEALLPVFEAVVNAIQAIEERGNLATGEISIDIIRSSQANLIETDARPIIGFTITDNGIGFDRDNFESFQTSDSVYKLAKGGKGIGRFLWLKAFEKVEIESVFTEHEKKQKRTFAFSVSAGIGSGKPITTTESQRTIIRLRGFKKEYRVLPSAYKTTTKIAQRVLEHCLSYFVGDSAPRIYVTDEAERICLNEIYELEFKDNISQETITLRAHDFHLTHIKLYSTHDRMHNIVLCADRRDVKPISLAKALGTSSQFEEVDRKFTYALYVTSAYLDKYADYYRLDFNFPAGAQLLDADDDVTGDEILLAVSQAAKGFLSNYLIKTRELKEERIASYIDNENPALRAVPIYCPEVFDEIDPNSSPERIDEVLYRFKGKAEFSIRERSAKLLRTQANTLEEIDESYLLLTEEINAFQKDDLVKYLLDRKRIISVLERKLELNKDGKLANEDIVHDIIFPRKSHTGELRFEDHNLWLIDEVIAFHSFAASDKPLNQTMDSLSEERPDIIAFTEVDEDRVARAVSVLEFKKPLRTKFDEDPTKQLYRYVREVKAAGKVKLPNGRDLRVSSETRFYCYAICDLMPAVREYCENNNYAALVNELGFYSYNRNHNAHTEILDFDKIVIDAKRRHRAFFDKLGVK